MGTDHKFEVFLYFLFMWIFQNTIFEYFKLICFDFMQLSGMKIYSEIFFSHKIPPCDDDGEQGIKICKFITIAAVGPTLL